MVARGLLVAVAVFSVSAFSETVNCTADAAGSRIEKFNLVIKGKEITGKVTGTPKPKDPAREYTIGGRSGTLKIVTDTVLKSKAGDAFLTTWKDGGGYSVFFSVEKEAATVVIVEPNTITTEYLSCERAADEKKD